MTRSAPTTLHPRTPGKCSSRPTVQTHPAAGAATDLVADNDGSFLGLKPIRIDKGKITGRFFKLGFGMENGKPLSNKALRVSLGLYCETMRHFSRRRKALFDTGFYRWSKLTEVSVMSRRDLIEVILNAGGLVMILAWTVVAWVVLVP